MSWAQEVQNYAQGVHRTPWHPSPSYIPRLMHEMNT